MPSLRRRFKTRPAASVFSAEPNELLCLRPRHPNLFAHKDVDGVSAAAERSEVAHRVHLRLGGDVDDEAVHFCAAEESAQVLVHDIG